MTSDETEFFIWLVERERSGTLKAKSFFDNLLMKKRETYLQLKNRVSLAEELNDAAKAIYYSDYLYSAIHMIVTIPKFQTAKVISEALGNPLKKTAEILEFLKSNGLVSENFGKLVPTSKILFIDKNSPFILQHHKNWRIQTLQNMRLARNTDVHLSMVVTLSEDDIKSLQRRISEFIEEISQKIKKSPEESLVAFGMDFFEVV